MPLNYVIHNNNNVYIRLNEHGSPITCSEQQKDLFEYSKAVNICNSLSKSLKRLNFRVDAVPEIPKIKSKKETKTKEKENNKVMLTNTYEPSENVTRWIDKLGTCEDIISEAKERIKELHEELSDVDLKLQDVLHEIELSDKCDMYKAWQMINEIRDLRKQRRDIKDEKLVLFGIKSQGISYLSRKSVQKCVEGLSNRKYRIRIVEDDED